MSAARRATPGTLLATVALVASGGARAAGQRAELAQAIDAYIAPYVETNNFSGQLLVMRGGTAVYERELSWANRAAGARMTRETELHIASISMQFTAAAIMRLVDRHALTLDTRVSDLVPNVRGGDAITIRNLLEQRSGLSDINSRADYAEILARHQTPTSLVAVVADDTLLFPTGTRYLHEEHSAYNLLALIIEKKSGLPFAEAMQTLVFRPTGMAHSGADDDGSARGRSLAQGYDPKGVYGLDTTTPIHWSAKSGNASVYSTAGDEARWVRQLFHGTFLSAGSHALIADSGGVPVGYGWFRRQNMRFGELAFSMNGRAPGFASCVMYLPREDLTVVAFSNIYSSATTDIGNDVAAIVLGLPYTPLALGAHALSPDSLGLDGATFTFPHDFYQPDATVGFRVTNGELFLAWPSGERSPIIPIDRDHAVDRAYWEPVSVTRDSAGRATSITYDRFRGERAVFRDAL
ncbi:MAG: beta-lactamase family protein [Gemmatimonadaceae bacterium]|nr:beta-lactamase family protein [Gemmatimonadaceae bacterium]